MPQESFAVSIGYPDVVAQNVQHLVDRIGAPAPGTTIAGVLGSPVEATTIAAAVQATKSQLGNVDFSDVATNASAAATAGNALINAVGSSTSGPIADIVETTKSQLGTVDFGQLAANVSAVASKLVPTDFSNLATKDDVRQLRWLVLKLWWLDHMCRHVTHEGAAQSVPAAALVGDLDVRNARGLANLTAKQIEEWAGKTLHEQFHLPLHEYEKMLGAFKPVAENLARQQASPTQSRTTSRSS